MTATILDGRKLSKELQQELKDEVTAFSTQYNTAPQLVVVEVEGDPASARYVRSIRKLCDKVGIGFALEQLPADVTQETLEASIGKLSQSPDAHGVLIQMPLPAPLSAERAVMHLAHAKDVDGIHPINAGLLAQGRPAFVPNTPAGGMLLLSRYDIALEGKRAAVIGRSAIVGRPMAFLLLQSHATVTICHSRTRNLPEVLQACDIVVVATGQPGLVHGDMLRPGAVVVDFGINVLDDGSMVGDVDFSSAVETASAITPVPGGTGPVTNVMLLRNVITAAKRQMSGNV